MSLSAELLAVLACPKCKQGLISAETELICDACRLAYPIRDDIPVMLEEEARLLT